MKTSTQHLIAPLFLLMACTARAAEPELIPKNAANFSLRNEVQHAIDCGLSWLEKAQSAQGHWSTADHPAVTALALTAFMREPSGRYKADAPAIGKGYRFLLDCVQPDGGIYKKGLLNYNTALSMMALAAANDPAHEPLLEKARKFTAGQQFDSGKKGEMDGPFDGGIGYGSHEGQSDLSNTLVALEALVYTKKSPGAKEKATTADLNWEAAIHFVQRCQNLPGTNPEPWASGDPQNAGGFIYYPGKSMAGETKLPDGKVALRSYGTMTYAGLLSYIYAEVKRDDPRVQAAFDWLKKNYTLAENPGMGTSGYYYYLHLMAKALAASGTDKLTLVDGQEVDWRSDLAQRLITLQQGDGHWENTDGRWWEKDPHLVTAYSVLALEIIYRAL